jgi:hypothetical protein
MFVNFGISSATPDRYPIDNPCLLSSPFLVSLKLLRPNRGLVHEEVRTASQTDRKPRTWLDDFEGQIASLREQWPDAKIFALFDCAFNERCHTEIKCSRLDARSLYDPCAPDTRICWNVRRLNDCMRLRT